MTRPFEFKSLTADDLSLLCEWLNRPHVAEIWDGPATLAGIREKYEPELTSADVRRYIAWHQGAPVGFIQSYRVMADPDFWPNEKDPNAFGVDLFLANSEQLGRGVGTSLLENFLRKLFANPTVSRVQIDPAPENHRAIRCYEKVGFRSEGVVETPDGPALLMSLDRAAWNGRWMVSTAPLPPDATRTRFTLIRHGETAWNANGRWQGHAPVPLNDEGRRQAQALGRFMSGRDPQIQVIVASDLSRAFETAQIVGAAINVEASADPRFREVALGEWQGLTMDEVRTWDAERLNALRLNPFLMPRPGGESWEQVARRALEGLEALHTQHSGHHIAVVSHGGTIRALMMALGLARDGVPVMDNTACTVLMAGKRPGQPSAWSLLDFNQRAHLL
jgi:broad specificity phosphatase PhoE/RimJ/RimL family protein N-acetyltransferase